MEPGFYPMVSELRHRNRGKNLHVHITCAVERHRMQMPIVYCWPLVANICVPDMTRCCCSTRSNHNPGTAAARIAHAPERVLVFLSRASNNGFFLSLRHYSRFCHVGQALIDVSLCPLSVPDLLVIYISHIRIAVNESCVDTRRVGMFPYSCFIR